MKRVSNIKIALTFLVAMIFAQNSIKGQTKFTADVFASYFGGSGGDYMTYVTTDKSGNIIIAGHGGSTNLPVKSAFQNINKGGPDGFIAKFNPELTQLIFCTYLGGTSYDEIKDVVVDTLGNIYVTGLTQSLDFPMTSNGFDTIHNSGGFDAFLSEFSPSGELLYSTFLGGSKGDCGMRIAVINPSLVLLTGTTASNDFPLHPVISDTIKGGNDVFLLKLDMTNNDLDFATRFGGTQDENPFCIKADITNNIYICGYTYSPDFTVKAGLNSPYSGKQDGFLCKFDNNGQLIFSSLVGGGEYDKLVDIAINDKNEIYFMGGSSSSRLTCTPDAFSSTRKGVTDIILGRINATGDTLKYFSYFGGNGNDNLYIDTYEGGYTNSYCYGKIGLLGNDKLIVSGHTNSNDFQISNNGFSKKSGKDIFVSILNIKNKEVQYFSYLGSQYDDEMEGLSIINDSLIVISGNTGEGFQVSTGAYSVTPNGNADAFVAKLKLHSTITSIKQVKNKTVSGSIYPNPTSGLLTVSFSTTLLNQSKAEIYNAEGKRVISKTSTNTTNETIDITGHPTGIYVAKIIADGSCYKK